MATKNHLTECTVAHTPTLHGLGPHSQFRDILDKFGIFSKCSSLAQMRHYI